MGTRFTQDRGGVLRDRLKAYWKLNERGGRRTDLVGTNHLTDFTGGNYARGRKPSSQVAQFTVANSEYLNTATDNALLNLGDINFSFAAWVYLDSKVTNRGIAAFSSNTFIRYTFSADRFTFVLRNTSLNADNLGSPSTATWYFIVCTYNATTDTMSISVNNGTPNTTSQTLAPPSVVTFGIGVQEFAAINFWNGRIAKAALWKKELSTAEIKALYNNAQGIYYDGTNFYPASTTLATSLSAWWELDETSGTRFDKVSPGTGPAAQFTAANSEYLSHVDNASLSTGDIDFTITAWVYLDNKSAARVFVAKEDDTTHREYRLQYDFSLDRFRFTCFSSGGTNIGDAVADTLGSPSTATWYFLVGWHDATANTINITVNAGATDSVSETGTMGDTTAAFYIGAQNSTPAGFMDGRITLVGFWKKVLTSTERTRLYNSGAGLHSTQLDTTLKTSFISYWDLNEGSGTRYDAILIAYNGNDLTDNNTVTQAIGVNGGNSLGDNATVTTNTSFVILDIAGFAGQFLASNSEYLSISDNPDIRTGDIDFTWAFWAYFDTTANFPAILSKGTYGTTDDSFGLDNGTALSLSIYRNTNQARVDGVIPTTGRWYFVVGWQDSVNDTINIQINNGPVISKTYTGGAFTSTAALNIAKSDAGGFATFDGRIAGIGFWKRTLTTKERSDLYNGGRGSTIKSSSFAPDTEGNLDTDLISYWRLNEVSGSRTDRVAANDLTDNATVTQNPGRNGVGYSAQFTAANSEYLSIPTNSELSTGDIDFTACCWVYLDSKSANREFLSKQDAGDDVVGEWRMQYNNAVDRFRFVFVGNSSTIAVSADALGSPSTGQWYFVMGWHDSVADTINIRINNGTINSLATGGIVPINLTSSFRIGAVNSTPANLMDGRIDEVGFWKRRLTSQEHSDLYNGGFQNDPSKTLINSLISYWNLNEVSGTRADSYGTNNLTDNATVTQAVGKVGDAAQFTAANSEYLSHTDNASLSTGDIDFTIAAWVYFDTISIDQAIVSKFDSGATSREYRLYVNSSNQIQFRVSNNGTAETTVTASTFGAPSIKTWYFILAWHDSVANTINISVNNGTSDSASHTTGVFDGTADFRIGAIKTSAVEQFMDGRIDEVGFWKKVLTAQEQTSLYTSGNGRFTNDPSGTLNTSLISYWNLNESDGSRADSYGGRSLTDNNTVTQAVGKVDKAAQFRNANSEYLSISSSSSLQTGDIAFSLCAWVYLDSKVNSFSIISKFGASSTREYNLLYLDSSDRFVFAIYDSSNAVVGLVSATTLGSPSIGTWYFVVAWHDPDANTVNISVNNGTTDSSATTGTITAAGAEVKIGSIGATPADFWDGRIDELGFWKKILTSTERTALYNLGNGSTFIRGTTFIPASGTTYESRFAFDRKGTLGDRLISYWQLDEVSGTRIDILSAENLTDNATVTQATGKIEKAGQFTAANSEYLSRADNGSLSTGDIDFTVACWVYIDTKTSANATIILSKGADSGAAHEYTLKYQGISDNFKWSVSNGTTETVVVANAFGSALAKTWYFVVAWHDSVNNEIGIQVNNGTPDTLSHSAGSYDSTNIFTIGATSDPTVFWDGRIDEVGFWKRTLTAIEKTDLYNANKGKFDYDTSNTLLTNLKAYWNLDEPNSTRFDTITPGTGPAAQFTNANSEYLSHTDNAALSTGNIDFSFACWVYLDSKSGYRTFISKDNGAATSADYALSYSSDDDKFLFIINNGGGGLNVTASTFGSPSTATWYFVVAWHDSVADTMNIQINNGAINSVSTGGTAPADDTGDFRIGAFRPSTVGRYMDGRITLVGFWKKVLSASEKLALYNSGAGLHSTQLSSALSTLRTSLISYWNLNEGSGTRFDGIFLGGNDLTDNNTVTQATGLNNDNSLGDNATVTRADGRVENAGQFVRANLEYLSVPDNDSLSLGSDTDFTITAWVYLDSKTTPGAIVAKGSNAVDNKNIEYIIKYVSGTDVFRFQIGDGTNSLNQSATTFGSPSTATWYFIVAWHDSVANTINIQINNGTIDSSAWSTGTHNTTDPFEIGRNGNAEYIDGRIDEVGFWKKVLTAQEKTDLYSGGAGQTIGRRRATTVAADQKKKVHDESFSFIGV